MEGFRHSIQYVVEWKDLFRNILTFRWIEFGEVSLFGAEVAVKFGHLPQQSGSAPKQTFLGEC